MANVDWVTVMIWTAAVAGGLSLLFLWAFLYENVFAGFWTELQAEESGVFSAGFVAVRKLGGLNRALLPSRYEAKRREELFQAGEPHQYTPADILLLQEIGFGIGTLLGLMVCNALRLPWYGCFVLSVLGALYPLMWLKDQVKKRHLLIQRALPYSLDLLTLAVEAGLDFTAALGKVVEKSKPGPLRDELSLVLKQLKVGKTREEALKGMIARIRLQALTTFVTALVQADRMGTSLGRVLRIQSTQLRLERSQRAEKLAGEAPVKMLFPLIACIFPTVFLILFGPILFWGLSQ
jgi:tight adherence protein C